MQSTGGGGGGGNELSRSGLQRYRSAPATWLDALLETDLENEVVLDPAHPPPPSSSSLLSPSSASSFSHKLPQLPPLHPPPPSTPPGSSISRFPSADLSLLDSAVGGGGGLSGFLRQNSSPAEFLSAINSDGYFSSFSIPANFDYLMPSVTSSSPQSGNKRPREVDSETTPTKLSTSPLKVEQSEQLPGGMDGSLDAEFDKLSEDSVLFRVRAKRGCATHPRSVAERVRRTRISDRIRKLQELVPNMDKQTNTADMLEEAVEYVKYLQKQIQELTEHQKRCKCSMNE